MGILEDLISVDDSADRLIALHCRPCIVILIPMDLTEGGMAGIDMGRVVEHDSRTDLRELAQLEIAVRLMGAQRLPQIPVLFPL